MSGEVRKASERETGGGSGDAAGLVRDGAVPDSPATLRRPRLELPAAVRAHKRIERMVQEQKRTTLRHKQHLKTVHTNIHTHTGDLQPKSTHTHAQTHHSHKLLERRAIHRNAPSSSTVHPLHQPPLSFSPKTSHYPAKDCQNI